MVGRSLPDCLRCGMPLDGYDVDLEEGVVTCLKCGDVLAITDPRLPKVSEVDLGAPPADCFYHRTKQGLILVASTKSTKRAAYSGIFVFLAGIGLWLIYTGKLPIFPIGIMAFFVGTSEFLPLGMSLAGRVVVDCGPLGVTVRLGFGGIDWRRTWPGRPQRVTLRAATLPGKGSGRFAFLVSLESFDGKRLRFGSLMSDPARAFTVRAIREWLATPPPVPKDA